MSAQTKHNIQYAGSRRRHHTSFTFHPGLCACYLTHAHLVHLRTSNHGWMPHRKVRKTLCITPLAGVSAQTKHNTHYTCFCRLRLNTILTILSRTSETEIIRNNERSRGTHSDWQCRSCSADHPWSTIQVSLPIKSNDRAWHIQSYEPIS